MELGELEDTGVMLLAAMSTGGDESKICDATGLPVDFIRQRVDRLKENEVWTNDDVILMDDAKTWQEENVAFVLLCLCAEGKVTRIKEPAAEL